MKETQLELNQVKKQLEEANEGILKSKEYTSLLSEVDILRHKAVILDVQNRRSASPLESSYGE